MSVFFVCGYPLAYAMDNYRKVNCELNFRGWIFPFFYYVHYVEASEIEQGAHFFHINLQL